MQKDLLPGDSLKTHRNEIFIPQKRGMKMELDTVYHDNFVDFS